MSYDTSFTDDNKQKLKDAGLYNVKINNTSGGGVKVNIAWTQTMRSLTGCEEAYQECDYRMDGTDTGIVKVFVAQECGTPPDSLDTSGCQMGAGKLHFGYIFKDDDEDTAAIFFVIHPNSWGPYQHRFRTTGVLKLLGAGASKVAGVAAGAAAGAAFGSVFPIAGTAVGAIVGGAAGLVAGAITPSLAGQYLRYIG